MAKKKVTTKKKSASKKRKTSKSNDKEIKDILIKNFKDSQKATVNLIEKFDELSNKISNLLELFEDSAKVLVKKELKEGNIDKMDKEILEKMNRLMDQNKIIAKGLTLIHEKEDSPEEDYGFSPSTQNISKPQPQKTNAQNLEKRKINTNPNIKKIEMDEEEEPVFNIPE